jgi:TRAP-type mannitol/chloroaromatic compound transport system permease large subunit
MFIAAINSKLTFKMINESIYSTCRANGLVFLIFLGATGFSYVFRVLGGDELLMSTLTMQDVFRGMYPFVALQVFGLMLCIYYPSISLWLPRLAGFLD